MLNKKISQILSRSQLVILASLCLISLYYTRDSGSTETRKYMGAKGCGECHKNEYEKWAKSAHAKSIEALKGTQRQDLTCLYCHATDAKDNFKSYKLENVQCEACHGSGAQYAYSTMAENFIDLHKKNLKTPDETVCMNCHTRGRTPIAGPFSYSEKIEIIRHWK
jgi:hypothetical protein